VGVRRERRDCGEGRGLVTREAGDERGYRTGYRATLGEVVRGLLSVEAERIEIGELLAALSRYEEAVEAWMAAGDDAAPPEWQPTVEELGADDA
jgi:hypothetical protein